MPPQTTAGIGKSWALRIVSIIYGLLIVPGTFIAKMAGFVFDAPDSESSLVTNLFTFSLSVIPLVLVIACVGGLVCSSGNQSSKKVLAGRIFGWLPMLNLLLILIAIVLLQTLCGGSFVCHL